MKREINPNFSLFSFFCLVFSKPKRIGRFASKQFGKIVQGKGFEHQFNIKK